MAANQITLGEYVFRRLQTMGVDTVFGVPGDFNLQLLDYIEEIPEMTWVGNTNELNAAYETDGYSRVNGFGALITTFGVGELSALNGVAGSCAEHIGMVHIVGGPSISSTENKLLLHHTLGDRKYDAFEKMSSCISEKTAVVRDINTATDVVDDIFLTGFQAKRPVYLLLPSNFFTEMVDADRLKTPLNLAGKPNEKVAEEEFVGLTTDLLKKAKHPIILVDACAGRHDAAKEVAALAAATGYPVFTTPLGKSTFSEDSENFYGTYLGALTNPDVKEIVESADAVLSVGGLPSDYNTGSFTYGYHTLNVVEFHSNYCMYKSATFENLELKGALTALTAAIKSDASINEGYKRPTKPTSIELYKEVVNTPASDAISQEYLWKRLSTFLQSGDVLVAETGTSSFGILGTHLPEGVKSISQVLWGSIGFSLPAATGASFAVRDQSNGAAGYKRVILFIGDGSLQLTVQAISDILRWKLPTYLFVLNNNGYTIEKLIHGLHAEYNQIQAWDHLKLLDLFAENAPHESTRVSTVGEIDSLLKDKEFNTTNKTRLVEIMLPELDAPEVLIKQGKMAEKMNAGH